MKNIHLLPTDKPSRFQKTKHNNFFLASKIELYTDCIGQHIYITSDEEIKEGDWHFNLALNLVEKTTSFHNGLLCEKIILATDPQLIADGVQAIDNEFLEWFVKNPSCKFIKVEPREFLADKVIYEIIIPKEEPKPLFAKGQKVYLKEDNNVSQVVDDNTKDWSLWELLPKQETLEETTEINLTRLCYYDKRNPDFQIKEEYGYDKEEVEATGNFSKKDCACDNCFYGRSKLTEQLIWQKKRMYSEEEVIELLNKREDCINQTSSIFDYTSAKEWFEQFKK